MSLNWRGAEVLRRVREREAAELAVARLLILRLQPAQIGPRAIGQRIVMLVGVPPRVDPGLRQEGAPERFEETLRLVFGPTRQERMETGIGKERRQFFPAGTTWIPSITIPTNAWKAERAAARIVAEDQVFGKCWHRCDVLYCDQLPFGVLQWKTQTTLDSTGEVIAVTTWVAEQK